MNANRTPIARPSAMLALLAAAGLLLAGCAGTPTPAPADPGSAGEPSEPSDFAPGGDTECVTGRWSLDVADYQAQAETYLLSLGIPLDALSLTGTQQLDITPAYLSISSALRADAVVAGVPMGAPLEFAGGADWMWEADDPTAMGFENWSWTVAPTTADGAIAIPAFLDPSISASVACAGDSLSLQTAGAPFVGNFVRAG
ncbi:MAG TPA: hypothetical protein VNR37_00250 [Microbacteriaceae bacterium]|nr:hypothetical protein [Microbacteriaceae bacterium]